MTIDETLCHGNLRQWEKFTRVAVPHVEQQRLHGLTAELVDAFRSLL